MEMRSLKHSSWIGRTNILEMSILLKVIYRFNDMLTKIPMSFFTEMEKSIIRFIRKNRRPQIAKAILSKMSNAGGYYNTRLQVILWNHSNKTRMVLAQKQVCRPME
jgi:hypothetical protein